MRDGRTRGARRRDSSTCPLGRCSRFRRRQEGESFSRQPITSTPPPTPPYPSPTLPYPSTYTRPWPCLTLPPPQPPPRPATLHASESRSTLMAAIRRAARRDGSITRPQRRRMCTIASSVSGPHRTCTFTQSEPSQRVRSSRSIMATTTGPLWRQRLCSSRRGGRRKPHSVGGCSDFRVGDKGPSGSRPIKRSFVEVSSRTKSLSLINPQSSLRSQVFSYVCS